MCLKDYKKCFLNVGGAYDVMVFQRMCLRKYMDFIQMKKFGDLRSTADLKRPEYSTHASGSVTSITDIIREKSANHTLFCCNFISDE
jgi:hypothetical protein